jgi:hypothetical protein
VKGDGMDVLIVLGKGSNNTPFGANKQSVIDFKTA